MGAITGTNQVLTEFGGDYRIHVIYATVASASDTITLTSAAHNISTIQAIIGGGIRSGMGANFATLQITFSGLVITVASFNAAGAAATTFGAVTVTLIGH